jgi:restriction system protein
MSKVNLNYGDYLVDSYEYDLKGNVDNQIKHDIKLPKEYQRYVKKMGYCPFCREKINRVYDNFRHTTLGVDFFESINVWECDCGFWEAISKFSEEKDLIDELDSKCWEHKTYSIIASVQDLVKEKAVKQLINEIKQDNSKLYSVEPTRFEQIAQYVFSSYFNCEVEHVGKSHDGGVDLLIINSDKPILVQVKRREKAKSVESVSTVRDLLGAMYIRGNFKGIILSTAKSFSKPSQVVIEDLKFEKRLEYFELFDFPKFCSLLEITNLTRKKNWEFLLKPWE